MKVCITGALGHIGSQLIRQLNLKGLTKIYLVDNLMTQRYCALFDLPGGIPYEFKAVDILSDEMAEIVRDSDVLVHLAASTDAETSFHRPEIVEEINEKGLKLIADLCATHQTKLIFPSTTSVYGKAEGVVDENCSEDELKPQSPYADSKINGENYLIELGAKGLNFVIIRVGTIFGDSIGMRFHTAVNKFIWQASMGLPISVWRTAMEQKRPYCDLTDLVQAVEHIIGNDIFDNQIYNIVTSNFAISDIVSTIKTFVPSLEIELVDSPIMNQLSYEVSNQKSLDKGFTYAGSLEAAVKRSITLLKNANTNIEKANL